jgi:hypothetical protein
MVKKNFTLKNASDRCRDFMIYSIVDWLNFFRVNSYDEKSENIKKNQEIRKFKSIFMQKLTKWGEKQTPNNPIPQPQ